jgi:hypothetical protein
VQHPPSLAGMFSYRLNGKCPFPALQWNPPHNNHCYKLSCSKVAGRGLPLMPSPASLFIYSSMKDCPSPTLQSSGCPALFATCLFVVLFIQFFFSLFSLDGVQSVQGSMLIWPRVVCGSIACRLAHLEVCFSRAGRSWHLAAWEPSWFLCLTGSGDAIRGVGVWRSHSCTSSWWFFLQGVSPASLQDFTLGSMLSASSF